MWISEVFRSVQGEGQFAGTDSLFIRTSGCNLRCTFCDTPYTSWQPEGTERSLESLADQVKKLECEHVVITGGEPLLVPDVVPLTTLLRKRGHFVTIETAGTVWQDVAVELMSISPKLQNSIPVATGWEERHNARRDRPNVIRRMLEAYRVQFKFVVDQPEDIVEVGKYVDRFEHLRSDQVFLMPQGTDAESIRAKTLWIREAATRRGWRVSPRLHIELFGNTRGT